MANLFILFGYQNVYNNSSLISWVSNIVNGVKAMSPFYILPSFNLVYGFVIDYYALCIARCNSKHGKSMALTQRTTISHTI